MNHSTRIASLFLLSAPTMLALPACMAGATDAEGESQENQGAPEQIGGVEKGAPEQISGAEKGSSEVDEHIGKAAQKLYGYGYYPPGYAPGLWYGGGGSYNPGYGYYQPGYGYLPGGYGYNSLPPGYGYWRPGYGYWRPYYGYWRGYGPRRYGFGW
jgi:hypothetical protein